MENFDDFMKILEKVIHKEDEKITNIMKINLNIVKEVIVNMKIVSQEVKTERTLRCI